MRNKNFKKYIPNTITFIRLLLTIMVTIGLFYGIHRMVILILVLLVYLSDYLDGKIARKYTWTSRFGAVLDVWVDMFFMGTTYMAICILEYIEIWFLLFMIIKFLEFNITSAYLKEKKGSPYVFDFLGRLSAILFYVIPVLVYFTDGVRDYLQYFVKVILINMTVVISILSSIHRILCCVRRK